MELMVMGALPKKELVSQSGQPLDTCCTTVS
jgi:hypothetical protein